MSRLPVVRDDLSAVVILLLFGMPSGPRNTCYSHGFTHLLTSGFAGRNQRQAHFVGTEPRIDAAYFTGAGLASTNIASCNGANRSWSCKAFPNSPSRHASWNWAQSFGAIFAVTEMQPWPHAPCSQSRDVLSGNEAPLLSTSRALTRWASEIRSCILDANDIRDLAESCHRFDRNVDHCPSRDVVEQDWDVDRLGNLCEMPIDSFLRRLVVVTVTDSTASAPADFAWRVSAIASSVELEPAPAITGTRPRATSRQVQPRACALRGSMWATPPLCRRDRPCEPSAICQATVFGTRSRRSAVLHRRDQAGMEPLMRSRASTYSLPIERREPTGPRTSASSTQRKASMRIVRRQVAQLWRHARSAAKVTSLRNFRVIA